MIVFIDWISTPDHAGFNQALFEALRLEDACCYIFDDSLETNAIPCRRGPASEGRLARFWAVREICAKHRCDQIIYLSYDAVLLPFLGLQTRRSMTFEHNTVPEDGRMTKHGLWQWLLFPKILRMAQFPAQHEALSELGQRSVYIGSPILTDRFQEQSVFASSARQLLVPSFRAEPDEIEKIAKTALRYAIIVKQAAVADIDFSDAVRNRLTPVDRIEMDTNRSDIIGIVITVTSRIRGTGWFNDALARGIPLVISNSNALELFQETFPGMPCISLSEISSDDDLSTQLHTPDATANFDQILRHNETIRARFLQACTDLGWSIKLQR